MLLLFPLIRLHILLQKHQGKCKSVGSSTKAELRFIPTSFICGRPSILPFPDPQLLSLFFALSSLAILVVDVRRFIVTLSNIIFSHNTAHTLRPDQS